MVVHMYTLLQRHVHDFPTASLCGGNPETSPAQHLPVLHPYAHLISTHTARYVHMCGRSFMLRRAYKCSNNDDHHDHHHHHRHLCTLYAHAKLHTHVHALLFLTRLKNRPIPPEKPNNVYVLVHSIFMCASKSLWYRSGVICYTERRENLNLLRVASVHVNIHIHIYYIYGHVTLYVC